MIFHDLYREQFDPIVTESELLQHFSFDTAVQAYMDDVLQAEVLVFIHPDWWGQMPALLKGWFDRVFRPGVAYEYEGSEFGAKKPMPLLENRRGLAFCTTDNLPGGGPHPLERIWIHDIFAFCGIEGTCRIFYEVRNSNAAARHNWLKDVQTTTEGVL